MSRRSGSTKRNPWNLYAAVRQLVEGARAGKMPEPTDQAGHTLIDEYVIAAEGEKYNELASRLALAAAATTPEQIVYTLTGKLDVIPVLDAVVALQQPKRNAPAATQAAYDAELDQLITKIYNTAELILDDDQRKQLWDVAEELIDGATPERALSGIFDIEYGDGQRQVSNTKALQDRLRAGIQGRRGGAYYDDLDFSHHDPHPDQDRYSGSWISGLRLGEGPYETSLVWRANERAFQETVNNIPFFGDDYEWHSSSTTVAFRVSAIPNLHQMTADEIAALPNMKPTFAFAVMFTFARRLENYPLLDEDLHSQLEMEATTENVREIAERFVREDAAPENWVGELIGWFWENDQSAIESRDDDGGFPDEEQVIAGLTALGYLDEEEAAAYERRTR